LAKGNEKMTARPLAVAVLGTAILLSLSACSGILPGSEDPLKGTSWQLMTLGGSALIPGSEINGFFEEGQVGGSAGCNSYGGSYQVSGDKLTIGEIIQTEMACLDPPGVMEQEQEYLQLLGQASSFSIRGHELRITTSGGDTLTFMTAE
jgi:heat shock protein HslJ